MKKIAAAVTLLLLFALAGCGKSAAIRPANTPVPSGAEPSVTAPEYEGGRELFTLAKTREEAQAIADQYGIELVEFGDGVAVFHTQEDPYAVVQRGAENGWTPIEVNSIKQPAS